MNSLIINLDTFILNWMTMIKNMLFLTWVLILVLPYWSQITITTTLTYLHKVLNLKLSNTNILKFFNLKNVHCTFKHFFQEFKGKFFRIAF
jgi:hypothetical protein